MLEVEERMKDFLVITLSDAVYRVELGFVKELHEARLGKRITELFFNDEKYLESWIYINIGQDDIREQASPIAGVLPEQTLEWESGEKFTITCA